MEQLDFNLLSHWIVGLSKNDTIWDRLVFSLNRDRLFTQAHARDFFERIVMIAEENQHILN